MKSDNLSAILTNESVNPSRIPPTNAPIKRPIPSPNLTNISIPLSKNSSALGTYVIKAPIATNNAPNSTTTADNTVAPIIAAGPVAPTKLNKMQEVERAFKSIDKEIAVSIGILNPNSLIPPTIKPSAPTTNVNTPTAANAIGLTV